MGQDTKFQIQNLIKLLNIHPDLSKLVFIAKGIVIQVYLILITVNLVYI